MDGCIVGYVDRNENSVLVCGIVVVLVVVDLIVVLACLVLGTRMSCRK
jgi:hypothetical protein